jgi:starvation-inducible DNA-binding protein
VNAPWPAVCGAGYDDALGAGLAAIAAKTAPRTTVGKDSAMKSSTSSSIDPLAKKLYATGNDITSERRVELIALMNKRLASAIDLESQMKQAHWNVKGPSFIALHELFDQVHTAVEEYVDLIAERIVQLGGVAEGTTRMAAAHTRLQEYPLDIGDGLDHVQAVAKALSTFAQEARAMIEEVTSLEDADSADIFTEISRGTDKWLWFVEAHGQAAT